MQRDNQSKNDKTKETKASIDVLDEIISKYGEDAKVVDVMRAEGIPLPKGIN